MSLKTHTNDIAVYRYFQLNNRALIILIIFLFLHVFSVGLSGLTSKVIITSGGNSEIRTLVGKRLTAIVNSFESQEWNNISNYCTKDGLKSLKELVENTSSRNVNPLYESKLLVLPGGGFEVRDIKVKVDMKKTKGNPYQYMVFELNEVGIVRGVRFAMERQHYERILKEGEELRDFAFRQSILQFLEIFRTAYNRKDLDYLRKVFSEDALIIVGHVLKEKPDEQNLLEKSILPPEKIEFLKLSKKEYFNRLENIFKKNDFIKVIFEELEIKRHPKIKEIYGATLKQNWQSSSYSDSGYLFLMIDFKDANNPLIHVRSWQPEKFPDGSIISLGHFELIE